MWPGVTKLNLQKAQIPRPPRSQTQLLAKPAPSLEGKVCDLVVLEFYSSSFRDKPP